MKESKSERQQKLLALIDEDPLLTDERLADRLDVSVQTIRLDRLELGLPEMRVRAKELATRAQAAIKALGPTEVMGELIDVELGRRGVSILETTDEMAFQRSGIVRGHHLFAQGNSLAVAVIDADVVLTGSARLRFHRPVTVGDRVIAKARVRVTKDYRSLVSVTSHVEDSLVFSANLIMFSVEPKRAAEIEEGRMS